MNKVTLTILAVFLAITYIDAQKVLTREQAEQLIQKIAICNKGHKTIICDFNQKKHISVLNNDVVSSGKYYYQKDDNMCMIYSKPQGNVMLMNKDVLLIIENNKRSLLHKDATPFAKQMRKMLTACMSGDIAHIGLSSKSKIKITEFKNYYQIDISTSNSSYTLQFNIKDLTLKKLLFSASNGDYTEYSFFNVTLNKDIDKKIFDHTKY